jgi:hypothetical protein
MVAVGFIEFGFDLIELIPPFQQVVQIFDVATSGPALVVNKTFNSLDFGLGAFGSQRPGIIPGDPTSAAPSTFERAFTSQTLLRAR